MGIVRDIRRGDVARVVARFLPGCHQVPNLTALNRYPDIFAAAAAPHAKRVLSRRRGRDGAGRLYIAHSRGG